MNVGRDAFGFLRGLRDLLFEIRFQQKDTKAAKKDKTRCVEQRGLAPWADIELSGWGEYEKNSTSKF